MMSIKTRFAFFTALLFLCGNALAAPSMSDREAKALVEAMWENLSVVLPLGTFTVVQGQVKNYNPEKGSISSKWRNELVGWAKVGIVTTTADQISSKITVAPTESGRRLVDAENPKRIKFSQGKFIVTKVAKNEERKKGLDDYRVVMVAYDAEFNSLLKQHSQIMGKHWGEKRKAIVLFKWEPFSSKWKKVVYDVANVNEEFERYGVFSNRVAYELEK